MIVQRLKGPHQSGKTALLMNLARGAACCGSAVLFVVPTSDRAPAVRLQLPGVRVMGYHEAVLLARVRNQEYSYILLDDCHAMPTSEGDPVSLVLHRVRAYRRPPVVVGAYRE